MVCVPRLSKEFELLSILLFQPESLSEQDQYSNFPGPSAAGCARTLELIRNFSPQEFEQLRDLAFKNHVIVRSFCQLEQILVADRQWERADWISVEIRQEQARIEHALRYLAQICTALEEGGCPAIVIKSLDHLPDLGSDLDLYIDADADRVIEVMEFCFDAKLAERSWGDRIANKWNFIIPGLPELVEVHVSRLGQTGEQTAITGSLSSRARWKEISGYAFRVPAPEDRIIISTLQRMYRHFYVRLCDVIDNVLLLDLESVDFPYLHGLGTQAGLWDGVATYLTVISQYVEAFRGLTVPIPPIVAESAKFGADQIRFRRDFLRIPILPHSLSLYATELKNLLRNGEIRNSLRLSLLPGLATAAAIEQKVTGSDKGIW